MSKFKEYFDDYMNEALSGKADKNLTMLEIEEIIIKNKKKIIKDGIVFKSGNDKYTLKSNNDGKTFVIYVNDNDKVSYESSKNKLLANWLEKRNNAKNPFEVKL